MQAFEEHGGDAEAFRENKIKVKPLLAFKTIGSDQILDDLPFSELDYFELVDQTGRVAREDKRGKISQTTPKVLQRLGVKSGTWLEQCLQFEALYKRRSIPVVSE